MFDEAHGSVFLSEHGAAQKSESGRSVCTIIDSLQSPLEGFSRQSMVVLPTIRAHVHVSGQKWSRFQGIYQVAHKIPVSIWSPLIAHGANIHLQPASEFCASQASVRLQEF